jgi:hypothetical protein
VTYRRQTFIKTRYFGPTDKRGARMKATNLTSGRFVTVPYDSGLSDGENHEADARAALAELHKHAVTGLLLSCDSKASIEQFWTQA